MNNIEYHNGNYFVAVNLGDGDIVNTSFHFAAGPIPAILQFNDQLQLKNFRYHLAKLNRNSTSIAVKNGPNGIFHYFLLYPEVPSSDNENTSCITELLDEDLNVIWSSTTRNGKYVYTQNLFTVNGYKLCLTPQNSIFTVATFEFEGGSFGDLPGPVSFNPDGDVYIRKDRPATVDASSPVFADTHCPTAMAADPDLEQHLKAGNYPGYDRLQWWDVTGKLLPAEQSGSWPGLRIGWVSGSAGNCVFKVVQGVD